MWTADTETYGRVFVEMLDYYLQLADDTNGNPPRSCGTRSPSVPTRVVSLRP